MKITFIRHTQVALETGICYGQTDVEVATSFPEEAQKVYESIRADHFDAVYSSPLRRCRQLAAFCHYPDAVVDERLKELDFGSWEMQKWEEIKDPQLEKWYEDWIHLPAGGAESYADQCQRVFSFLEELRLRPYQQVCVFTHRGVIACAMVYAGICTVEDSFQTDIPYGSKNLIVLK